MAWPVRFIAYYLPQFHVVPENEKWWWRGFTEWDLVKRMTPLFKGHLQPKVPSELGYYDLLCPDTREAQAELAGQHGIEGFCYWHYWFGNGKRILETPFNQVLESGRPDFPFCLAWANHDWRRTNHGHPAGLMLKQLYPGKKDQEDHFYEVVTAFADDRYIKVDGKPLFLVYLPRELPDASAWADHWRELALRNGLKGLYLVGLQPAPKFLKLGFDKLTDAPAFAQRFIPSEVSQRFLEEIQLAEKMLPGRTVPSVFNYSDVTRYALQARPADWKIPVVISNFDNTPRMMQWGFIFLNSTPAEFRKALRIAVSQVKDRSPQHRIVFIRSWNEWGEGNYLEPDTQFGRGLLEALRDVVKEYNTANEAQQ